MEVNVKLYADPNEMESTFKYDDILNVTYYEKVNKNTYNAIVRIPECDIKDSSLPICLSDFKQKVLFKNFDKFPIYSVVSFKDGTSKVIHSFNEYWANISAKKLAEAYNKEIDNFYVVPF